MSLILHCGARHATMEEIGAVEVPMGTDSYRPVPHNDIIRLIEDEVERNFRLVKPERSLGLSKDGQRLFGTLNYDLDGGEENEQFSRLAQMVDVSAFGLDLGIVRARYKYTIAFRNSYDKSMSLGICGGTNVTNCDNLCLFGSDFKIVLKHAPGVWERAVPQVVLKVRASLDQYLQAVVQLERMRGMVVSDNQAYETIGVAQGQGILTPNQANRCFQEYRQCAKAHEFYLREHEHGDEGGGPRHTFAQIHGSSFALYQHFTESLKLGQNVSRAMDRYTGVSRLFEERGLAPRLEA